MYGAPVFVLTASTPKRHSPRLSDVPPAPASQSQVQRLGTASKFVCVSESYVTFYLCLTSAMCLDKIMTNIVCNMESALIKLIALSEYHQSVVVCLCNNYMCSFNNAYLSSVESFPKT